MFIYSPIIFVISNSFFTQSFHSHFEKSPEGSPAELHHGSLFLSHFFTNETFEGVIEQHLFVREKQQAYLHQKKLGVLNICHFFTLLHSRRRQE